MTIYLRDIRRYQPLTAEEETTLAHLSRQGDSQAREQLIHANLPLVVRIASRYLRPDVELLDLVQEGNIGLIRAVDKFNPDHDTRFSTFAVYWIKKHILLYIERSYTDTISLDTELADGSECLLSDTIADEGNLLGSQTYQRIDERMEQEEMQEHLRQAMDKLSPNDRQVLQLLYGLDGYPAMERTHIAKVMRIQSDQVSRIKTRALSRLKELI